MDFGGSKVPFRDGRRCQSPRATLATATVAPRQSSTTRIEVCADRHFVDCHLCRKLSAPYVRTKELQASYIIHSLALAAATLRQACIFSTLLISHISEVTRKRVNPTHSHVIGTLSCCADRILDLSLTCGARSRKMALNTAAKVSSVALRISALVFFRIVSSV